MRSAFGTLTLRETGLDAFLFCLGHPFPIFISICFTGRIEWGHGCLECAPDPTIEEPKLSQRDPKCHVYGASAMGDRWLQGLTKQCWSSNSQRCMHVPYCSTLWWRRFWPIYNHNGWAEFEFSQWQTPGCRTIHCTQGCYPLADERIDQVMIYHILRFMLWKQACFGEFISKLKSCARHTRARTSTCTWHE